MPSKYYTPPASLVPNTTAHSGTFNTDFAGVDAAFQLVQADMQLTLSHKSIQLTPLNQSSAQMAGKIIGVDSTGLALVAVTNLGTWRGTWVTLTQYNSGDIFQDVNPPFSIYYVVKNYTSGASVAADVAAGDASLAISLSNVGFALPITSKTASFNAAVGNIYLIPSAAATVTVTLPAGSSATPGQSSLIIVTVNASVNQQVQVAPNGTDLINGVNATMVLRGSAAGEARAFNIYWSGATAGWLSV